jgi:predicted Zn-dependent protease
LDAPISLWWAAEAQRIRTGNQEDYKMFARINFLCRGRYVLLVGLAAFLSSCATVPLTNRTQVNLLPESQMVMLGEQAYTEQLKQHPVSETPADVEPVRRVGERLAAATEDFLKANGLPTDVYAWEFSVIDNKEIVNATCLPGGKIVFYSGIFQYTQDEDGIATVMGHEIAHAIARHGNERVSEALLLQLGAITVAEAMKTSPTKTRELTNQAFGLASNVGVALPFNRKRESEADRIGLTLMAKAGYDPRKAIPFWERFSKAGKKGPEFLSTHPAGARRIADIKTHLPEALEHYTGDYRVTE